MGLHRLHRILRKDASTLVETLVAMTLVAIVAMTMVSGILTAMNIYKRGAQLMNGANEARGILYAPENSAGDPKLSSEDLICFEYFWEYEPDPMTVYSYTVTENVTGTAQSDGITLYYCGGRNAE